MEWTVTNKVLYMMVNMYTTFADGDLIILPERRNRIDKVLLRKESYI